MTTSPIDTYLARVPEGPRAVLESLRQTIRSAAPGAEEVIRTRVPAFRVDGRPLVGFGAAKGHLALYVMYGGALARYADELAAYDTSSKVVRFTEAEPLPSSLVVKIVEARLAEIAEARGSR